MPCRERCTLHRNGTPLIVARSGGRGCRCNSPLPVGGAGRPLRGRGAPFSAAAARFRARLLPSAQSGRRTAQGLSSSVRPSPRHGRRRRRGRSESTIEPNAPKRPVATRGSSTHAARNSPTRGRTSARSTEDALVCDAGESSEPATSPSSSRTMQATTAGSRAWSQRSVFQARAAWRASSSAISL